MKAYLSVFRLRRRLETQYRGAALGGILCQVFFGLVLIALYRALYAGKPQPMPFSHVATYVWLQQAFFRMLLASDADLMDKIRTGGIAYDLCRPLSLYGFYYARILAQKLTGSLLRAAPMLVFAMLLPEGWGISPPASAPALLWGLAALCLGFAAGRFTDWLRPVPSVAFTEPLIERAVRLKLGRERGTLSPEDLARVRNIFIFGSEVYADRNAYSRQSVDDHDPGPVRTLDDLALLPSLEEICIARQGYLDVSGIAGMSRLYSVEIKHCRISGIQPIADLTRLKHLCLFDCGLTDVTALENCPWLETLDVGYNNLTDLKQIGSHPSLRSLNIAWLKMNNVDDIARRMPKLRVLYLQHGAFRDLSGLRPLPDLETVYVLQEQFNEISSLFAGTDVEIRVTEN